MIRLPDRTFLTIVHLQSVENTVIQRLQLTDSVGGSVSSMMPFAVALSIASNDLWLT